MSKRKKSDGKAVPITMEGAATLAAQAARTGKKKQAPTVTVELAARIYTFNLDGNSTELCDEFGCMCSELPTRVLVEMLGNVWTALSEKLPMKKATSDGVTP